jgi:hypothetical protein
MNFKFDPAINSQDDLPYSRLPNRHTPVSPGYPGKRIDCPNKHATLLD